MMVHNDTYFYIHCKIMEMSCIWLACSLQRCRSVTRDELFDMYRIHFLLKVSQKDYCMHLDHILTFYHARCYRRSKRHILDQHATRFSAFLALLHISFTHTFLIGMHFKYQYIISILIYTILIHPCMLKNILFKPDVQYIQ